MIPAVGAISRAEMEPTTPCLGKPVIIKPLIYFGGVESIPFFKIAVSDGSAIIATIFLPNVRTTGIACESASARLLCIAWTA